MNKTFVYIIMCLLAVNTVWTDDLASRGYGEYGAEFLKLPRNAHAAALGFAVTAWEEDLAGLQVNPAILASAGNHYTSATYTYLTLDRLNNGFDYAGPVFGNQKMAVSVTHFGVGDIEEAVCVDGCSDGQKTGEMFSDNEFSFDITYAGNIPGWLSYGVRARYLYQTIGDYDYGKAQGTGFDAGIYYLPWDKIGIGVGVQNLASRLWWSSGRSDWVVPTFRAGVVGNIADNVFQTSIDLVKPWSQPMESSMAAQVKVFKVLSLRAGLFSAVTMDENNDLVVLTPEVFLGFGLRYSHFGFDYAAMKPGGPMGMGHKFTMMVRFPNGF